MNEKQEKYIEVLRATGNPSKARVAAGVSSSTVRNWKQIEEFAEAFEDARAAALDDIVEASRAAALAGSDAQMTNWMKLAHPELRSGTNVAVGVRVGGDRVEQLPDDVLVSRAQRVLDDLALRQDHQPEIEDARAARQIDAGGAVDVEAVPPCLRSSQNAL